MSLFRSLNADPLAGHTPIQSFLPHLPSKLGHLQHVRASAWYLRTAGDRVGWISETENAFRGAFQENPACSNLVLKLYDTSSPKEFAGAGNWRLTFGIAVKDGNLNLNESAWSLFSHVPDNTSGYAEGNMSNPYEAAGRVCAIVKGVGGKLK